MEEGDFDYWNDIALPILLKNGFVNKSWHIDYTKFTEFVYEHNVNFMVYEGFSLFHINDVRILKYPVKLKHRWFTKTPYLKYKKLNLKKCHLCSQKFEELILMGIKLDKQFKKELALQEDF